MRFYSQLLKCLKDCFDGKFEALNFNMNFLILLKNEVQTPYMKQAEVLSEVMRKAIMKNPLEEDVEHISDEREEVFILEKILNNIPIEIDEQGKESE